MKVHFFTAVLFLAFSVGCEKEDDEKIDELKGTWVSACIEDKREEPSDSQALTEEGEEGENEPEYNRLQVAFDGEGKVTASMQMFSDASCATKTFGLDLGGSYSIGNDAATPVGAKEVDMTWTSMALTIANADYLAQFNQMKFCGFEDFELNVAKDVSSAACGSHMPSTSKTEFDIFKVEGSLLFFGDKDKSTKSGESAAERIDVLETVGMTKQ